MTMIHAEAASKRGRAANRLAPACAALLAGLALPACTVGPDYQPPAAALPGRWSQPLPEAQGDGGKDLRQWWRGFKDARLDALVERALRDNPDLKAADGRIAAARAQQRAAAAGLWPGLNASTAYQRQRISPNALKGILSSAPALGNAGPTTGLLSSLGPLGRPFDLFQAGFDATWELDLFGGIRRQAEAAEAGAEAEAEGRRGVRVSLGAEVARDYLELIALRRRLGIARLREENHGKVRQLAEQSFHEGLATALDVRRAKAELEEAQAQPPGLEAQIKNARHGLALLLGQPPAALDRELAEPGEALPSPPAIPAGLPADLLRRRPDIRQAERELAAATAGVGAAVAELFPKLTLTGAVGLQSQNLGDFADLSSGFYGFGPRLSLPIFQAGRLKANIAAQEGRAREALARYEKTVLAALREAEDALAALDGERRRRQSLLAAEASRRANAEAAVALYAEGEAELQTVLDTQRDWYDIQEQLVSSELAFAAGHVALFKALGGGWGEE